MEIKNEHCLQQNKIIFLYLIVCLFLIYHVPCECCCCKAHVLTACKRCLLIERELNVRARQLWAGDINESVTVEGCR